jgi:hypothetical protein
VQLPHLGRPGELYDDLGDLLGHVGDVGAGRAGAGVERAHGTGRVLRGFRRRLRWAARDKVESNGRGGTRTPRPSEFKSSDALTAELPSQDSKQWPPPKQSSLFLGHRRRGDGRQAIVEIGLVVGPMRDAGTDQFAANVAEIVGRRDGQHDEVRRIVFARDQAVASRLDRLGGAVAGGREVGPDQDIDSADLGGGLHEQLR